MKFSCPRESIADAFQLVASVTPQRSLKPILTRAKVTVDKKKVLVEGTDLEVAVRCSFAPTAVDEEGSVAVLAEKVASIAREATDEEIRVESEGDVVSVLCGDGYYKILGEAVDNFPPIPEFKESVITLSGGLLADMVQKTAFAAAEERSRYSLNGVFVAIEGKKIILAATDGRRLAMRQEKLSAEGDARSGIVPLKGMSTIRRVVEDSETVDLGLTDNMIMVRTKDAEVYSKLIEGKFPDYTKVVPSGHDRKVAVERQKLLLFIRRAALLCSGESRAVKFSVEKGSMKLSARTAEIGEAELSLPVDYSGPAMDIDFNPDYIIDVLRVLDADKAVLELKNSECAGMIKGGKGYTYVVMPLSA